MYYAKYIAKMKNFISWKKNYKKTPQNLSTSLLSQFLLFECKQCQIVIAVVSNDEYTIYGDIVDVSYIILSILITFSKLLSLTL